MTKWETVGDSCEIIAGPAFKSAHFREDGEGIRLLRGENVEPGALRWTKTRSWPTTLLAGYERFLVKEGDLILGMDRPIVSAGLKLARVTSQDVPALLVQRVARIRARSIDSRYAFHWLSAGRFASHLSREATGTQLPHVTLHDVGAFPIPRFDEAEELRIVDLLEDYLSRLDAADTYLESASSRAGTLLESTLQNSPELTDCPTVPLSRLLAAPLTNGRSVPTRAGGFPVLRLTALRSDRVDLRESKPGAWTAAEAQRFLVRRGDVFVSRGNGSLALVGRAAAVHEEPSPVAFPDTLIRVRPDATQLTSDYLVTVWNSRVIRRQIERIARTTAGIYKVNQGDLSGIQVPLPSLTDQQAVLARVAELRDSVRAVDQGLRLARQRSARLRQALFANAFSGDLTADARRHANAGELASA